MHNILSADSNAKLAAVSKEIEAQGHNAFMKHMASLPKNPHEKGSSAYKVWQKGHDNAAKGLWGPKEVKVEPKQKGQKAKKK